MTEEESRIHLLWHEGDEASIHACCQCWPEIPVDAYILLPIDWSEQPGTAERRIVWWFIAPDERDMRTYVGDLDRNLTLYLGDEKCADQADAERIGIECVAI